MATRNLVIDKTFVLGKKLGQGGMGTVYRAVHRMSGKVVAVKVLRGTEATLEPSNSSLNPRLALTREFQILSSLHHPNIVKVLDYGFDEVEGPYVVMELLTHAQTILEAAAPRTQRERVLLFAQLLLALAYLHHRQIVHRDLKPSNVLFSKDTIKVLDFGLASPAAQSAALAGTFDYVAPELWLGQSPTVGSDLYACGVIACQLLTGQLPERRYPALSDGPSSALTRTGSALQTPGDGMEITSGPRAGAPLTSPVATIPGPLGEVVRRLLEDDPANRYSNPVKVLADLSEALGEPLPIETVATRESFLQAAELIGRERELDSLLAALRQSAQGVGSNWLIGGESGVGKSRLMSELRTHALVEGAVVVQGQAITEGGGSYHVWLSVLSALCMRVPLENHEAAVLKDLVPNLARLVGHDLPDPPALPPTAARTRLLGTIEALFRKQPRPAVVLLEDLQWADVDSLALLRWLTTLAPQMPLLVLGSYRDDEAAGLPENLPAMQLLRLNRLDKEQCASLSESMLGANSVSRELVDFLFRETDGNVFFLVEILRELAKRAGRLDRVTDLDLPERVLTGGIDRLAQRRFNLIPPHHRDLVMRAAVAGRELDFDLLRTASPHSDFDGCLLVCTNAAILEMRQGSWRFVHDKLREAILLRIPADQTAQMHNQIAHAALAVYDDAALDAQSATLAYHFEQGRDTQSAWSFRMRAGDRATRLCAYAEARLNYASALRLLDQLEESDDTRRHRIDTLLKQVYARLLADAGEENFKAMTEAKRLLDDLAARGTLQPDDQLRLARVTHAFGRIHFYRGDVRSAIGCFEQVLPLAQQCQDDELMALPALLIGTAFLAKGNVREAEPLLAQSIGPVERLGEPFEWFRAVGYHGAALIGLGRYREGLAELDRVLARATAIGQPSLLAASHLMRGSSLLISGDWPLVVSHLQRTIELAAETGELLLLTMAWSGIGWARSFLGEHAQAAAARERGRAAAKSLGGSFLLSDWYDAGDAEIALNSGRTAEALATAQSVAERSIAAEFLYSRGIAERVWGAVLANEGDAELADAHLSVSVNAFEQGGMMLQAARTRIRWAVAKYTSGHVDDAVTLYRDARQQFEDAGCTYALAEADAHWAMVH